MLSIQWITVGACALADKPRGENEKHELVFLVDTHSHQAYGDRESTALAPKSRGAAMQSAMARLAPRDGRSRERSHV